MTHYHVERCEADDCNLPRAEAAQGALDDVRARVEHIRGLASGDGGDEASRTDPWNALTTIVINCDELLAALQDRGADREDVR